MTHRTNKAPHRALKFLLIMLCALTAPPFFFHEAWAEANGPPLGMWFTADRTAVIKFERCGSALCARIAGMSEFLPDGSSQKDVNGRPQCGLPIMTDLTESQPGVWAGHVTDPSTGSSYNVRVWLDDTGRLNLRGYILGISLLGSTQVWYRYTDQVTASCRMVRGST